MNHIPVFRRLSCLMCLIKEQYKNTLHNVFYLLLANQKELNSQHLSKYVNCPHLSYSYIHNLCNIVMIYWHFCLHRYIGGRGWGVILPIVLTRILSALRALIKEL